jgi:hypothetical protein
MRVYGYNDSFKSLNLGQAFNLWTIYENKSQDILKENKESLSICFENLLKDPVNVIEELEVFLGLELNERKKNNIINGVNANRAFAFRRNPDLLKFAATNKLLLEKFGYNELL